MALVVRTVGPLEQDDGSGNLTPVTLTQLQGPAGPTGPAGSPTDTVNTVTTSGSALTIPAPTTAAVSLITLTAACTLTLPAPGAGRSFTIVLVQDSTGSRVVTWATPSGAIYWPGGAAPTLTTTAAARDIVTFTCADGTNWYGLPAGYDLR